MPCRRAQPDPGLPAARCKLPAILFSIVKDRHKAAHWALSGQSPRSNPAEYNGFKYTIVYRQTFVNRRPKKIISGTPARPPQIAHLARRAPAIARLMRLYTIMRAL